jgi:hypothetical protein
MENHGKTVLCAVSHAQQLPWFDIWVNGQCKTWQNYPDNSNFTIINFFGRKPSKFIIKLDQLHERIRWTNRYFAKLLGYLDIALLSPYIGFTPSFKIDQKLSGSHSSFVVNFPDTFVTYRWKILSLIRYFLEETDFDFLYVTSTSSYIRPVMLLEEVSKLPNSGIYSGPLPYESANFVSGSSRLMSRDVVQKIWGNRLRFGITTIEDKAMAQLLGELSINPIFFQLINVTSAEEAKAINATNSQGKYHFRLKTIKNGRREDISVMTSLHENFKSEIS